MEIHDEIDNITKILEEVCGTQFDDEFSVTNNGIAYKLGNDSKIISKIYELVIIDQLTSILKSNGYTYIQNDIQNKYPDFIIVSKVNNSKYYAVDIKCTYLKTKTHINGFTLGTYKGYFKNRETLNNILKPYNHFYKHFCICVIYDRCTDKIPVKHILLREKWQIASNSCGSGNTCNIGSIKLLCDILTKKTYFASEHSFDNYWLSYKC